MNLSVEPTSLNITRSIQSVHISVEEIILFQSISFIIQYFDEKGYLIFDDRLITKYKIEKEEYQQWGQDDTYIIQKIYEIINQGPIKFTLTQTSEVLAMETL